MCDNFIFTIYSTREPESLAWIPTLATYQLCKLASFLILFFSQVDTQLFQHLLMKIVPPNQSCIPQPQQRRIRAVSATYTTAHGNAGSLTH